jgi:hypothetical protein
VRAAQSQRFPGFEATGALKALLNVTKVGREALVKFVEANQGVTDAVARPQPRATLVVQTAGLTRFLDVGQRSPRNDKIATMMTIAPTM